MTLSSIDAKRMEFLRAYKPGEFKETLIRKFKDEIKRGSRVRDLAQPFQYAIKSHSDSSLKCTLSWPQAIAKFSINSTCYLINRALFLDTAL